MNKKLWLTLPVSVLLACVPAHQALTTFEELPAYPVGNDAPRIPSHGALKWQDWVVDAQLKSLIQEAFDKNLEIKYLERCDPIKPAPPVTIAFLNFRTIIKQKFFYIKLF